MNDNVISMADWKARRVAAFEQDDRVVDSDVLAAVNRIKSSMSRLNQLMAELRGDKHVER